MSSIQTKVDELQSLRQEIKRINQQKNPIQKRIKMLESEILVFMDEKEHKGLKYKDVAILKDEKIKTCLKAKKTQKTDMIEVLKKHGITNPENLLDEIDKAKRKEEKVEKKIKIVKRPDA